MPWLLVLLLAAGLGFVIWWFTLHQRVATHDYANDIQSLNERLESLQRDVADLKDHDKTLRARLNDGEQVDKSVRAQLLALNQRVQNLEDGVGKLANQRMSGHDSLALDQAELLLTLGAERMRLFHDVTGTVAAYRDADMALKKVSDTAFSPVRQSIRAEIEALNELRMESPATLIVRLGALRESVAHLPTARVHQAEPGNEHKPSRLWRILGSLVLVKHEEINHALLGAHDTSISRNLLVLDFREAEAAALAGNASSYRSALEAARKQIRTVFDTGSPGVVHILKQIDELQAAKLEPQPPPAFGTSLRQLRNLRATRALREPEATPTSSNDSSQP